MKTYRHHGISGFSLVELLVVIAVIAILAAVALLGIGPITGAAADAKDQRNAQNIASVYSSAIAANAEAANPVLTNGTMEEIVTLLRTGVTGGLGALGGAEFKVDGLTAAEVENATNYLSLDATPGALVRIRYTPGGGGS